MTKSTITKKYRTLTIIFTILSFAATIGPLIVFFAIGFSKSDTGEKVVLTGAAIAAIILTLVSVLLKYRIRSTIFILLMALYSILNDISTCLLVISIGVILDEFLFTPLQKHFSGKYKINAEIDKRLPNEGTN